MVTQWTVTTKGFWQEGNKLPIKLKSTHWNKSFYWQMQTSQALYPSLAQNNWSFSIHSVKSHMSQSSLRMLQLQPKSIIITVPSSITYCIPHLLVITLSRSFTKIDFVFQRLLEMIFETTNFIVNRSFCHKALLS